MNLIASVLELDRRAVRALRITDAYSLHRVVYSLYEDVRSDSAKTGSTASGILYADQGGDIRGRRILMLADRSPHDRVDGEHGRVEQRSVPQDFLDHELYRFKVVVNPTRRDSASRKLVSVKGREAIADWFRERAIASWGFEAISENLQVGSVTVHQFKDKHQNPVTLAQAEVGGILKVADPDQFKKSFAQGIGRARGFGCGLLQIVPLSHTLFH